MSPTAPSPSSSITTELIPAAKLRKNPWNPNRMTPAMRVKIGESIGLYGFVDPLTVREVGYDEYQIIDGEHRFEVGQEKPYLMTAFPCINLGLLDDAKAKKLTIIMNELHGQADPDKMGDLLASILADTSLDELLVALPYDESILAGYLQLPALPPLESSPGAPAEASDKTVWVERLFKIPKEAALVVDEALEKAKDGERIEQWQALERVAADYLAS